MGQYAREVSPEERARLNRGAKLSRPLFTNAPQNETQAKRGQALRENKVLVRGRFTPTGEVWDVVKVEGGRHELYARGLRYMAEAIELAIQCMKGRIFISVGSARALLTRSANGTLSPIRDVHPGHPQVTLVPQDGRFLPQSHCVEVRPGAPAKVQIEIARG